jgi:hypothetical protein
MVPRYIVYTAQQCAGSFSRHAKYLPQPIKGTFSYFHAILFLAAQRLRISSSGLRRYAVGQVQVLTEEFAVDLGSGGFAGEERPSFFL